MNPSETSSFDREYQALKTGRAVVTLAGWSSISVTGSDRQTFLNNFCTNDIKRLAPGTSCETFFTNVKGKIVGHGIVDCRESAFAFVGPPGQAQRLIEHLDRYVIREDVKLYDATSERAYLLVAGEVNLQDTRGSISWNILGRDDSRLIELEPSQVSSLVSQLLDAGLVKPGAEAFTAARVEAATPLFGIDFNQENLPQEIGRDRDAISFTKGCYLGQETVARIDALGHVNHQIRCVRFPGFEVPPRDTELLFNDRNVGVVTSSAFSPKLGAPLALAMVRREANAPGTRLESPFGACEVVAR